MGYRPLGRGYRGSINREDDVRRMKFAARAAVDPHAGGQVLETVEFLQLDGADVMPDHIAEFGREEPPDGSRIGLKVAPDGIEPPALVWSPSIGISGLMVYMGDQFPAWRGSFFTGGLSGLGLQRFRFNERGGLMGRESLMTELKQRIRDVRQGPDGCIYVAVDASPGGVLRLEPAPPPQ